MKIGVMVAVCKLYSCCTQNLAKMHNDPLPPILYTRVHLDHGQTPFPDTLILHRQARVDSVVLTLIIAKT